MGAWRAGLIGALVLVATAAGPALGAFPESPPNDPLFDRSPLPNATNEQWDLAGPALGFDRGIDAVGAWPLSTGEGVVIADIDVGVQAHPDLAGRLLPGYDFWARDADAASDTNNAHGTNVAGVLAATADNGIGIAGVAPGSRVLPVRTMDNILHQSSRLAEGIVWSADAGARVMSMSLGAESYSPGLRRAVAYAHRRGSVMVAAMGNEFHFHHNFPASFDEVIAVGGLNPDTANAAALEDDLGLLATDFRVKAAYSDFGPHIDVVAPTQVPTTQVGGGYTFNWSGTSAATPHVAGTAALVFGRALKLGMSLRPGEVRQIIRMTADDLTDAGKGFSAGWDRLTGWGRVNAARAVARVGAGRIPPEVNISAPRWYAPRRGRVKVLGGVRGRSATRWTLELGRDEEPQGWRTIATGVGRPGRLRLASVNTAGLERGGWTLRLHATDAQGNRGEDRAFFLAVGDQGLKRRFPRDLKASGEASPALANLAGGRAREIVLATSAGKVHVLNGRTGRNVRGWPRRMRGRGARRVRRRIGAVPKGILASPAVGNIRGGPRPEVVAAGLDGRVYAWGARGRRVRGFPVGIDLPRATPRLDRAIYATPALADLRGDRRLEIVVGAADQKVYAWNGRGRRLPGWPVPARDGDGGDVAKILSSPAVGDLNGDGSPDVVEGSAEAYGSTPNTSGRVHAWDARGRPLPGWPVRPTALAADSIPLVGEGVAASPVLADVDGDGADEVAVSAFTGQPELFRGDGSPLTGAGLRGHFAVEGVGAGSPSRSPAQLAVSGNAAFGRTRPGGPLRYFAGLIDARLATAQLSPASRVPFEHLLGGWDAASGRALAGFPAPVEGWTILSAPALADVDGDGRAEAVFGTSGYLLHAFREDGSEPPGWPKQTGGWLLAGPAVGDIDGDRRLEVVAVTREGHLFAWDTPAPRAGPLEWPSFRHDPRNSGRYVP